MISFTLCLTTDYPRVFFFSMSAGYVQAWIKKYFKTIRDVSNFNRNNRIVKIKSKIYIFLSLNLTDFLCKLGPQQYICGIYFSEADIKETLFNRMIFQVRGFREKLPPGNKEIIKFSSYFVFCTYCFPFILSNIIVVTYRVH